MLHILRILLKRHCQIFSSMAVLGYSQSKEYFYYIRNSHNFITTKQILVNTKINMHVNMSINKNTEKS